MIKYIVAAFIAFGAMLSVSAQAAPTPSAIVHAQAVSSNTVQKVWHRHYYYYRWYCYGCYYRHRYYYYHRYYHYHYRHYRHWHRW